LIIGTAAGFLVWFFRRDGHSVHQSS
jgi:hypothetical protein